MLSRVEKISAKSKRQEAEIERLSHELEKGGKKSAKFSHEKETSEQIKALEK